MHTGASLGYPQCKCMTCAAARHEALKKETLRRHPDEYRKAEDAILEAEEDAAKATEKMLEAMRERDRIMAQVRQEMDGD